jgi:Fe-S oxidoreductase
VTDQAGTVSLPILRQALPLAAPVAGPRAGWFDHLAGADACIKCGACLAVCPTYDLTGLERESPRGRVQLVRAAAAGHLALDDAFLRQMYDCLDCRACEPVCPVGVPIGTIVLEGRAAAQRAENPDRREGRWARWLRRLFLSGLLGRPRRLEVPVVLARWLYQRTGLQRLLRASRLLRLLGPLERLEAWLPDLPDWPWRWRQPNAGQLLPAIGPSRRRAAYFLGCFMNTVFADAAGATVEVIRRLGVDVVTPMELVCCGAPQADLGELELARRLARQNVAALEATGAEVIFADCAACSGMLKEYGDLLAADPEWGPRARTIAERTRDFSELVWELLPEGPPLGPVERVVTYHEPCHLAHAQRVRQAPRRLLAAIPGLRFVEMADADVCCGSAGVYGFRRGREAGELVRRKVANAAATEADIVASLNPGCLGQLEMGLRQANRRQRVLHLSQILLEALEAGAAGTEAGTEGRLTLPGDSPGQRQER